jgi:hypothetical protein
MKKLLFLLTIIAMIAFTGKTQSQSLSVQVVQVDSALCYGQTSGSISAMASGGTPPYNYAWSTTPVQTTATITNLPAGTYTVTVNDGSANTATASATVYQPDSLISAISSSTNVKCYGQSNGEATVSVIGGTPAYLYQWDNGENTSTGISLNVGIHSVTVTDHNGCTSTAIDTVSQPTQLGIILASDSVKCYGLPTGVITATDTGGTPPYNYLWSNGQTGQTLINVVAGIYTVTLTDHNGCTASASAMVFQPSTPLTINIASGTDTMLTCGGSHTGSISLNIVGGTYPWSYHWNNGDSTQNIMNLSGGIYTITITDHNGCMLVHTFYISQPAPLAIHIDSLNALCPDSCNGQITSAVTGGTPFGTGNYTYLWSNGKTDENITKLCPGIYDLTVTDANGCQATLSTSIGISDSLTAYFTIYPDTTTLHHYYVENDATGRPPMTCIWNWGDGTQDTAAYPTHTYSTAGNYVICLTVSNGPCRSTYCDSAYLQHTSNALISVTVIPGTSGIKVNELSSDLIKIYPNPASNNLTIESPLSALIEITNIQGQLIKTFTTAGTTTSIDVSAFPDGVFVLEVRTGQAVEVKKFIKE